MNNLLNDNDEDIEDSHRSHAGRKPDREITLGTTLILGIFFALAVFGAVMFGFGYSIGGKHATATATTGETNPTSNFNSFMKPNSGKSVMDDPKPTAASSVTVPLATQPPQAKPATSRPPTDPSVLNAFSESNAEVPVHSIPASVPAVPSATARTTLPPAAATPVLPPAGGIMVQVAAVSHQEDADLLVSTLKRRNYAVAIHHEPQDQLLHVQIGPFANRKDADTMRLRLQADGFNAIVKAPAN